MTKMSRYALITALAMFLAGCVGQREPAPVEEVKPAPEQPATTACPHSALGADDPAAARPN